eukprot:scaffold275202_cov15-Tisochrysis_lutea.AAC.2
MCDVIDLADEDELPGRDQDIQGQQQIQPIAPGSVDAISLLSSSDEEEEGTGSGIRLPKGRGLIEPSNPGTEQTRRAEEDAVDLVDSSSGEDEVLGLDGDSGISPGNLHLSSGQPQLSSSFELACGCSLKSGPLRNLHSSIIEQGDYSEKDGPQ